MDAATTSSAALQTRRRQGWRGPASDGALVAGVVACALFSVMPSLALGAGVGLALTLGHRHPELTGRWTPRLLRWSVVGLGADMNLAVVVRVGVHGLVYTVLGIGTTLALGHWLGRWLRLAKRPALLVALGTAICGGSAIAAAAPVVEATSEETTVSMATVFILNGVALFVFPAVGHALHMPQTSFGLWAALAIHDTSSVIGAGIAFGPTALATATGVKLARALWIAPTTAVLGWRHGRARAHVPPFIFAFVAAAALGTFVPQLHLLAPQVARGARHLLVASLFLLGAGLSRTTLRATGARPLIYGLLLWLAVGGASLVAVVQRWIR